MPSIASGDSIPSSHGSAFLSSLMPVTVRLSLPALLYLFKYQGFITEVSSLQIGICQEMLKPHCMLAKLVALS